MRLGALYRNCGKGSTILPLIYKYIINQKSSYDKMINISELGKETAIDRLVFGGEDSCRKKAPMEENNMSISRPIK